MASLTCGRQSCNCRPFARIRRASQFCIDLPREALPFVCRNAEHTVSQTPSIFIEFSSKNWSKWRPGPLPEPQMRPWRSKMGPSGVCYQLFLRGSRFQRLLGPFFSVFLRIWGPPGEPKNQARGGHVLKCWCQEGSQDAIFSKFDEKAIFKHV